MKTLKTFVCFLAVDLQIDKEAVTPLQIIERPIDGRATTHNNVTAKRLNAGWNFIFSEGLLIFPVFLFLWQLMVKSLM